MAESRMSFEVRIDVEESGVGCLLADKVRGSRRSPRRVMQIFWALLLVVGLGVGCDFMPAGSALDGSLKLVPADVNTMAMWDVEMIMSGGLPEGVEEQFEETWGYLESDVGIHLDGVNGIVRALNTDGEVLVVSGILDKREIRDVLADRGYSDDTFRDYEVWSNGASSVALLTEEDGGEDYVVRGGVESVMNVLRGLSRDSGSLLDDSGSTTRRVLGKARSGWYVSTFDSCEEFRGCEAYAVAVSDRAGDFLVNIRFAFLFRNERAANSAASDVEDEIYDRYEIVEIDLGVEGEFVVIEATVDEDDSPY